MALLASLTVVAQSQPHKAELLEAGTRIGRYHLLQRLAIGGMAELYLACASGLQGFQKVVVLKHVLPHLATDPEFVQMFLNEARIAANLAHPNIVHVTDIGETSGDFFYVMEFVHGRNARELLRVGAGAGGLPLDVALTIGISAASALEHAHAARGVDGELLGLIHRDVSPANILVSYEGTAKLTDFGIAKASQSSAETIGGAIKGKIGYMSPEQCRGETVDQRTDIFALGVVLFELTTCQRVFYGENDFAILNKVLKGQIDRPSDRLPDFPFELEAVIMRALAAEREDRYPSAAELRSELETFAHEARLRCTPATVSAWMNAHFGTPPPPRVESLPSGPQDEPVPTLVVTAHTEDRESLEQAAGATYVGPTTVATNASLVPKPRRRAVVAGVTALVLGGGLGAWLLAAPAQHDDPVTSRPAGEGESTPGVVEVPTSTEHDGGVGDALAAHPTPEPQPATRVDPPLEEPPKASTDDADSPSAEPRAKKRPRRTKKKRKKKAPPRVKKRDMNDPFPVGP